MDGRQPWVVGGEIRSSAWRGREQPAGLHLHAGRFSRLPSALTRTASNARAGLTATDVLALGALGHAIGVGIVLGCVLLYMAGSGLRALIADMWQGHACCCVAP